jgi:hypothetical protein
VQKRFRGSWETFEPLSVARASGFFSFCWREETAGVFKSEYLLMCPHRWFNKKLQVAYKEVLSYPPFKADHLRFVEMCATVPSPRSPRRDGV